MTADAYITPGFFSTRVFNPVVAMLARRLGVSLKGRVSCPFEVGKPANGTALR